MELDVDPEALKEAGVRAAHVKVYYDVEGQQKVKSLTLRPSPDNASKRLGILLPREVEEYDYEISWRLRGRTVTSGRRTTSGQILFVDEPPDTT